MTMEPMPNPGNAIAIIGMSGRFPGAATLAAFWQQLCDGAEAITFFKDEELEPFLVDASERRDPNYVKAKGILEGIDQFDAAHFGFSPREAALTDPQHRLFLECAWEALESAGYVGEAYNGAIGVFAGAGANNYLMFNLLPSGQLSGSIGAFQAMTHNKNDHLATRTAYKLNLHGPAVTVQTACSTSLVAVHLACQSLLTYQSDMCLAGGVTISHPQKAGYLYYEGGIGSPDGHCRPFDAHAQGTVAGSGAGIVLLKRYEEAVQDGDTIHAVILASAINNDGAAKVGYTAPSVDYQAEVIQMAMGLAEISADSIGYVEAHGTGTPMGDPIEVEALTRAYRTHTERDAFVALGAVKSNLGHLDTAAGIAGLLKTVLTLKQQEIAPQFYFDTPNPLLNLAQSPFYIPKTRQAWEVTGDMPRRAGVSSFGVGGTNAHAILQEASPRPATDAGTAPYLLMLSARSDAALEQMCVNLAAALKATPDVNLADVAYTLQVGRKGFSHRRFLLCADVAEAITLLESLTPERVFSRAQEPIHRPITFMFPGQGAQYVNMGATLYETEPIFRDTVDHCLALLEPHMRLSLRSVLYPTDPASHEESAAQLRQTEFTQPALFVIEYALAQLWMSWGLEPQAMIGHSIGEYVAATIAGVMSLEDALALTALRGKLIQSLPSGAMLSVPLSERDLQFYLNDEISLAAVNGPALCVLSGASEAIDALEQKLTAQQVLCTRLHTSHAFHSHMMEPILPAFTEAVRRVALHAPQRPYLSNVTGTWITAEDATNPDYWATHLRRTVRFGAGLETLLQEPDACLLEVGPGQTLRTLARWHPQKKPNQFMFSSLPHPREKQADHAFLQNTIGQMWLSGVSPDWQKLYPAGSRQRVTLPTYPFQRQRYWIEAPTTPANGAALGSPQKSVADLLAKNPALNDWFYVPTWQETLPPAAPTSAAAETWLLFVHHQGTGVRFAEYLRQHSGINLITVYAEQNFERFVDESYHVNPATRADYDTLLTTLKSRDIQPTTIIHGWSLDAESATLPTGTYAFESLLYLANAIGSQQQSDPLKLIVLSNGLQEVIGGDGNAPEKATLVGPALVIPREYRHITCWNVDIDQPTPNSRHERALFELLRNEASTAPATPWVAYRHGRRWEKVWQSRPLAAVSENSTLRQGGVYLITGGMGGLGLTFADHLARTHHAKLVLVGRSPLPPREEWAQWLSTHDVHHKTTVQIQRVQALEAHGGEVLVLSADVADEVLMRQVVSTAQAHFGAIHGVIHAAGLPSGGMMQLKSMAVVEKVLASKVQGAQILGRLFEDTELDFMVLCSSLTSVVGRFGQVDYTAANAFLDAWAHDYQNRTGIYTVAINWGAWDDVGMVANAQRAAKPAPAAAPITPVATSTHPLVERVLVDTPDLKVVATDYNVDKHWVLDEHRILGHPVIPGVTYFEMVRAALNAEPNGQTIAFHDMLFMAPLRVRDGETREVRLVLERDSEGYAYSVRSDEGGKERTYAFGKVRLQPAAAPSIRDVAALRAQCNVQSLVLPTESREEDLGPRWHSVQRVHLGTNEALIELAIPDAFAADFDHMIFHPALQDRTAGIAKDFLAPKHHYLPFTYHRLTIHAPLQQRILSHVKFKDESMDGETIAFDILLMDEQGRVLVEIERFAQKRVNDPAEQIRALAALMAQNGAVAPESAEPTNATASLEIRPLEGAEALARILAHKVAPQVVVSVRDLYASIRFTDEVVQERAQQANPTQGESVQTNRPKFARPMLATAFAAPRDEVEQQIADVWQDTLGIEQVGIHDNFFELGGDSLVAIELVTRLSRTLGTTISPVSLFEGPTVGALRDLMRRAETESAPTFETSKSRGERRRAQLQRRRDS